MPEIEKNDFPAIQQVDTNLCGPACVEMLLEYLDISLEPEDLVNEQYGGNGSTASHLQHILAQDYAEKPIDGTDTLTIIPQSGTDTWSSFVTRPVEVVNMLHWVNKIVNDKNQKAFDNLPQLREIWFNHFSSESESVNIENFLDNIELKIKDPTHPPIMIPIHDSSHWIVLYKMTVTGKRPRDQKKTYVGKDPIHYLSPKSINGSNIESVAGIITISDNYDNFRDPANLVSIEITSTNTFMNNRMGWNKLLTPPRLPRLPQPLVTHRDISEQVQVELRAYGNDQIEMVGRRSSSLSVTPPLLVRRTDRPNYDYYLVTIKNSQGEVTELIRMDAQTGLYLDSLKIQPSHYVLGESATQSFSQSVLNKINPLPKNTPQAKRANNWLKSFSNELKKTDTQGNNVPNMVWMPSNESISAFFPFYKVNENSYVRTDGAHFSRLTAPAKAPRREDSQL